MHPGFPAQTGGNAVSMPELGFALSSEDHTPNDLVDQAALAEQTGFTFALISDHYHPWITKQGHAPFVWSTLGGIARATSTLRVGTGVTCPTIRQHPGLVAQAAATVGCMMPGRFFLGVGTGENLNEHVFGAQWPAPDTRLEMLEEAVEVMRLLWQGGEQTHRGTHYTIDHAQVFDIPDGGIDVYVAAAQTNAAELAGRIGDGLISTSPDEDVVRAFGQDKPKLGMMHVAYDTDADAALKRAHELWPNIAMQGSLSQELPKPSDFEGAAPMVSPDDVAENVPHGPDPAKYRAMIDDFEQAGFTHVYIHQIGENQKEFCEWAARELLGPA
jgi:G6PDH family F420-dependent oxidoreductase